MRAIRFLVAALFVVTAVLFAANGIYEQVSGRNEGPTIHCDEDVLVVSVHDDETALLAGVTAGDPQDGDLTGSVIVGGVSKLIGGDTAKVTCLVFDSDDNMASYVRKIRYRDYRRPVIRVTEPLVYADTDAAKLLERVTAEDIIDGDLTDRVRVSTLWATDRPQVYSATVMVTNSMGDSASVEVPVMIATGESGIVLREQVAYVELGSEFDPMDYVRTGPGGLRIEHEVDTAEPGCYWVWYFDDSAGQEDFAILSVVVE